VSESGSRASSYGSVNASALGIIGYLASASESRRNAFESPLRGVGPSHLTQSIIIGPPGNAASISHSRLFPTKHRFATDAIRRGVPERHLQTFLGNRSVESSQR
jgi:hypothetical protein